ncbi:MAG: hypothetical protein IK095_09935, partial [Oscillospiraceae bacterium]|nr:hypothetical protein [Oscillospiraceae bacterium]
ARFTVEKRNFRIRAETDRGPLYADREILAYNFAGELGDGAVHALQRFPGERIFGLGDKCGGVDKSGGRFLLRCQDAMGFRAEDSDPLYKYLPFWLCVHPGGAYGLFYDSLAPGEVDLGREHDNYFPPFSSIRLEEEQLVFYLILGRPDEIVRRFSALCGPAAPVPDWAFRWCGSAMAYADAPDADRQIRAFVRRARAEGLRPAGFYLSSGYTNCGGLRCVFHWDRERIPSPEDLAAWLRRSGVEPICNVKPAFLTGHPLYAQIAAAGLFLRSPGGAPALFPFWGGMASLLDFTHPEAYAFWKACVRRELLDRGYRQIWNDNNEYTILDGSVLAHGFGAPVPARQIRPLFAYLMARASREACLEAAGEGAAPDRGAQDPAPLSWRDQSADWSWPSVSPASPAAGETDRHASAATLARDDSICDAARLRPLEGRTAACQPPAPDRGSQDPSRMSWRDQSADWSWPSVSPASPAPFNVSRCAMAGTPRVASTWTGDNVTSFRDLRFQQAQAMGMALSGFSFFGPDIGGFAGPVPGEELFLRWLQFGLFLPRFVLHSWKPGQEPTTPWLYPERMEAVRRLFALREKFARYLYAEHERCRRTHEPLIWPVFLGWPDYDPEAGCFFCGRRVLACPVYEEGAGSVAVTLPKGPPVWATAGEGETDPPCHGEEGPSGPTWPSALPVSSPDVWLLRGRGEPIPGGTALTVPCRPEDEPVWFCRPGDPPFEV